MKFAKMFAGVPPKLSWVRIVATLAVMLLPVLVNAERLPIKTYTVADGLLRDNVYKIKQDSRGFLWFCTVEGISRFDGYAFTNFTTGDGLPHRHVNDFLETRSGTIYLATGGGLARLNPTGTRQPIPNPTSQVPNSANPLFTVFLPDNPRAKGINVLFEDENGAVFAGTEDGLYKLNASGELERIDLGALLPGLDALPVTSIIKDRRGAMWIGTELGGLYRILPNGEVERYTTESGLPDTNISILHEDVNGRIWVGLRPRIIGGLVLLVAKPQKNQPIVERHFTQKDGLPADWITDFLETGDGKFWVATIRGLCQWQGGEKSVCKTYTSANDLCDTEIWSVLEDKDKNIWTGTRCGLKKWTRHGFTTYDPSNGTVDKNVNSIFENAAGEFFISMYGGKRTVSRFDGENFDVVKPNFPSNIIYFGWGSRQTVWQDAAGDWWFPTGGGLYRFPRPARFEDLSKTQGQKVSFNAKVTEIFRLFEDSHGDFWIVTTGLANELWRWERAADVWHDYTLKAGIGKNRIGTAFVEDRAGNLWIGTGSTADDSALIRYRDGHFQIFPQMENALLASWLHSLFVDGKGKLWIASTDGLLRLDDVNAERLTFVRYTPAEGLSSIGISSVTEDEFGRIYIGTGRGLDRLNPETGQVENFTTADGLPNSEISLAYRDRKNNLWFGTVSGLARFIPEPERQREPPNIFIMGLRVSGVPQSISILGETTIPSLELDSDQRQVTVEFLGLGTNLGERLKYEYRFGDAAWTSTNERTVNFVNLTAGGYRFEVRAQTADRIYSPPATVSFRIAAPVWQRWWFLMLAAFVVFAVGYSLYRYRIARLLEVANMRTRIATNLHDDIGANLTKIAILSEVAKQQRGNGDPGSDGSLSSIARISRESVAAMSDIVWAINPQRDSLRDLVRRMRRHAEELFTTRDIGLTFNAPPPEQHLRLSVDVRRDLFLIFKEAVNNTARHSRCTEVAIALTAAGQQFVLEIADNGVGFDPTDESEGNGLMNMRRRAANLGGEFAVQAGLGQGTRITLSLPYSRAALTARKARPT